MKKVGKNWCNKNKNMGLEGKLEREIEVKAEADKFYNVFRKEMHLLTTVCSQHLKSVELHHGDWETLGSVKHWNYHLGKFNHYIYIYIYI